MSSPYDDLKPEQKPQPRPLPQPKPIPELEDNNVKSIFASKTILANLVGGAVALLAAVQGSDIIAANPEYAAYAATAMAVLNLILRLVTNKGVSLAGK
jgi:hypothetical protein